MVLFICIALLRAAPVMAQFGETTQYFPHFALGGGWTTVFTIHNPSTSAITVQVQLFRTDGSSLSTRDVALVGGGTQNVSISPTSVLTTGWARLTSAGRFSGNELFQFLGTGGQLISEVGVLPSTAGTQFKLFGTVQSGISSSTGIAVANPSATLPSVLTVRRFDSLGTLQDSRTVTLGPQQQLARFLNEDPYFTGLDNFDGIVDVSATQPVTAVTLRLDGAQIAAVGVITPQSVTALTTGSVTTDLLADAAVTSTKVAPGQLVKSINSLKDDVILAAGTNVAITALGSTLTINSTATTGAKGDKGDPGVPGPANPDLIINTGSPNNTAVGKSALQANTSGTENTATGFHALQSNTTGHDNMANGYLALQNDSTGYSNTASGAFTMIDNTTGYQNVANGYGALQRNTSGVDNMANGYLAMWQNTTGQFDTASGTLALQNNTIGESNTASGFAALRSNTTGGNNTASGVNALLTNATGSNNTAIGYNADVGSANLSNATAIGAGATVTVSNKIRLGNGSVSVIEGQVAYTFTSDKTKKENFRPVDAEDVLKKIQNLDVTSWNYIGNDAHQFRHYGPMAQDFFAAFGHDDVGTIGTPTTLTSGDVEGIQMIGLKAVEKRTAELRHEIELLKAAVAEVKAELKSQLALKAAQAGPATVSEQAIDGNVDLDSNGDASVELLRQ